jgi:hypothetical protein
MFDKNKQMQQHRKHLPMIKPQKTASLQKTASKDSITAKTAKTTSQTDQSAKTTPPQKEQFQR